jgi:hypothetical protein
MSIEHELRDSVAPFETCGIVPPRCVAFDVECVSSFSIIYHMFRDLLQLTESALTVGRKVLLPCPALGQFRSFPSDLRYSTYSIQISKTVSCDNIRCFKECSHPEYIALHSVPLAPSMVDFRDPIVVVGTGEFP